MYVPMINTETGEINAIEIIKRAPARATREWGGTNYPPRCLREALDWLKERAEAERRQWRSHRGLPPEDAGELTMMPSWGASGDSFGAR